MARKKIISQEEAERIALALVKQRRGYPREGEDLVIVAVLQSDEAWAFAYNTRSFAETGDILRSLIGNGAVIVSKRTGEPTVMPSSYGTREALRRWQTYEV